ncbi:flagellar motor protein MotA [Bacteroidia bacterium]|nr:flagellar motor protein MotA [Bacteroidia bacterium]GHT05195.1 flagellar motor protein MotA [Bacteroidia bacterium]GHT50029.1 flagellar motor protein MotA [Bacteroidia bacterium]
MKRFFIVLSFLFLIIPLFPALSIAQDSLPELNPFTGNTIVPDDGGDGFFQALRTKFIEGGPIFMSIIALTLILGLAFCLERIIYLQLAKINTKKFIPAVEALLENGDLEGAKKLAQDTRGPVASIYYQALLREDESVDVIDKSISAYGSVQVGLLEKNLSWITLFIAMAPSLGFLGTVVGMVQAFDNIELFGDINPTIVAGGMKVALITTVGGLIVALILQFFYNFILVKIESIVGQMEDSSIRILDSIIQYRKNRAHGLS